MAKLKDGFYKLTASSIGSDLHVLLAGGGSKPISDFALASDYVNLTGALTISGVKTFTTLLKFAVAKGTSPFTVTSSTLVANLNANYASELTSTYVSDPAKAYSTSTYVTWHTGGSTNFGSSGYMGNNYGFPVSNNANGILWLGTHSGPYGGLLGVSSNGRLYYRFITDNSFPTTANGGSWNRVAWVSDIPTKTSQLTNDSGFWTGTKYWANLEVGGSSNTSTTPTFGTFVRLNSSISEAGGDVYLEWWRGTNASWRILNNAGTLKFQCNYTSTTGSYYDAFKIDYNTGHSWIKGSLRVVGLLAGGYGATRAFYAGGDDTYVWIDSRDTSSNVKNNILLYDDRTSTKTLAPHGNNTYSLGTSSLRWSNIYSVLGNFRGLITSSVATGTSPFNVTSTTVNTNLNADLLDGYHATNFLYRSLYGGGTNSYTFNNGPTDVGWVYLGRYFGQSGGVKIECDYTSHCSNDYGIFASHLIMGVRPYTLEGFISKVAATGGGLYIVEDTSSGYKYYYVYIYVKAWYLGQVRIQNLGVTFEWSKTVESPNSSYTCVLDTRNLDGYYTCHRGTLTRIDNRDANTLDSLDSTAFMRAASANGYYGIQHPGGGTSDWTRTTVNGIIPYQSGGSGNLGTSSWPFLTVYANNFYGYLNGNISGTAASARDMDLIAIDKSLTLTTSWQDTGIYCSDIGTGSFVVRIEAWSDFTVGGGHYSEAYTGLMSSYSERSNSSQSDEIPLHRCGHAPNHGIIYLRTLRVEGNASYPKLQIAASYNATGASIYTFKFRRII